MARESTSRSSTRDSPAPGDVVVGRIVGTFGVHGEVKVAAADRDAFRPGLKVWLKLANGNRRDAVIDAIHPHKNIAVARLRGIDDIGAARSLQGGVILAARCDLPKLPAGTYRGADLVGMRVIDVRSGALGKVREIAHYPACDMLVVGAKRLLVPMLRAYGFEVDAAAGEIRVNLPAGFEELV